MNWKARWIWQKGESAPRNYFLYFRKGFNLLSLPKKASLSISADSRYILYLNGEYLGRGPARSFPEHQQFDSYNVEGKLIEGKNVVAVLVHHFGESNFQYIEGRGGLICQLDYEKASVISDKNWKVKRCKAFARFVPRVSFTQGFEEEYDSGKEISNWQEIGFDDSSWQNGIELKGNLPWKRLEPRDIPFLSQEPVLPVRILETEVVKPIPYSFTFNLRPYFFPGEVHSNRMEVKGFLFTYIYASHSEIINFYFSSSRAKLNGKLIKNDLSKRPTERLVRIRLNSGWNSLLIDISGEYHLLQVSLAIGSDQKLSFNASKEKTKPLWKTIIFPSEKESKRIWKEGEVRREDSLVKQISSQDIYQDVYLQTTFDEPLKRKPKIDHLEAICSFSPDYTIFYPEKDGEIRILLDFGKEVVGYIQFEVEGEEEVILDFNFFEAIEDGKIHFTGLNSWGGYNFSFRYITKEGRQTYRSYGRRGFRYAYLTLRGIKSPFKLRYISTLLNTYPVVEKGEFHSSDERLNKIWEVGAYTLRLCMEDTYVDCPCYEQTHWVGDARNEALINYTSFGAYDLSAHSLEQVSHSLKYNILPESQVPSGWRNIIPAWSFLWVEALYEYYLFTGDEKFLKRIYPSLGKTCLKIEDLRSKKGLFRIKAWNMIDWAPMDTPEEGEVTHNNALAARSLFTSAKIARVLKKKEDFQKFTKLAKGIKRAINRYCWNEKKKAYVDCLYKNGSQSKVISQQTNTIIYLCNCAQKERIPFILPLIENAPEEVVSAGSPFFMFFTLEALAKLGKIKEALSIIRKKWGLMLDKGATTFWETFPGFDQFWWTRSHCHGWSAGPTYFLSTKILGISPLEPGFKKVLIQPFPADLTFCRGKFPTPKGEIDISWENLPDSFNLYLKIPKGIKTKILLPKGKKSQVYLNGKRIREYGRAKLRKD
ncbi:MAG: family 78 glycoside hydrolase catalytic domain [Candidatus Omnitrophica bacterium]|nr:family 78 glycoside hydrolase catalytic domain [Candidatus Omnitrophota bacterium]